MLAVVRILLLGVFVIAASSALVLRFLLRPFHADNTTTAAHWYGRMHKLIGLQLEIRVPAGLFDGGPYVYIANHQNTWDIFTLARAMPPHTQSIGKKSLIWIPFFGQMYWLAGNILIDRKNSGKARGTIEQAADAIKQRGISILLFPEGTRSYGRGLLPFKTGAFRTAAQANVPIVPICVSNLHGKVKLNRWNNGKLIIEFLPPIAMSGYDNEAIKQVVNHCHQLMQQTIQQLEQQLAQG